MKKILFPTAAALGALLFSGAAAAHGTAWSVTIGSGGYGGLSIGIPPPVILYPAPVVRYQPPVVAYPAPVYRVPVTRGGPPIRHGHRHHDGHPRDRYGHWRRY